MAYVLASAVLVLLVIADYAKPNITNQTLGTVDNRLDVEAINKRLEVLDLGNVETRRQKKGYKKYRSTSSSSGEKKGSRDKISSGESLDISSSGSESDKSKKKKRKNARVSTEERRGWRKWHRKCAPCPEDEDMKWKDPRIKWICGAYQRARRTFKSLCMMHRRNCQDGTMFVKIHDHRCQNDSGKEDKPYGDHFFYEYHVQLSVESSETEKTDSSTEEMSISSY